MITLNTCLRKSGPNAGERHLSLACGETARIGQAFASTGNRYRDAIDGRPGLHAALGGRYAVRANRPPVKLSI